MTAAVPEPTLEGQIAEVVDAHALLTGYTDQRTSHSGYTCLCGDVVVQRRFDGDYRAMHAAHLAAALAPLVVEVREKAVEEALEAAAVRVEAKIAHVPDAAVDSGGFETGMDVGCEIAYTQAARIVRAGGRP